ncbi:MAG: DUF721 domain-containing protein [Caulobacteraceae bacterium]|nr:DUF721 domain-containing protein [Caulobacteraceae bacterium]
MVRPLPSPREAKLILGKLRTRPAAGAPPAAARALTPTLKQLEARFGQGVDGLKARWTEIVGEVLARRTEPVKLTKARGGGAASLEIRVEGAAATLIQHQAADILARVNLFLGEGAVERLRIVQGPLRGVAPSRQRPAPRHVPPPEAPLDAAAEAALAQEMIAVPEGPLRAALTRLGRAVRRRDSA